MMRSKKRERFKKMIKLMSENEDKYCDILWWTRKDKMKLLVEQRFDILATCQKVEKENPEEIKALKECDDNWQHGFNSGMLACTRLYLEMIEGDVNIAIDSFPFLDT